MSDTTSQQLVVFSLGSEEYALPIGSVHEIIRFTEPRTVASDAAWKQQDPQLPKSIWYLTDAQWLGFRLVRPSKLPTAEEMYRYWNSGLEHDEQ